jgi:hypothetical protein
MKIEPRGRPQADEDAQQEDTTAEFSPEPGLRVHRRTTVTVERETVSFFVRRSVAEGAVPDADPPAGANQSGRPEDAQETPDKFSLAASPETPDEADGGKP